MRNMAVTTHQDDQNKNFCPSVSFSFKKLTMGQSVLNIASAVGSWCGSLAANLLALILAPILSKVSEKLSPPHPPEPRMDTLLAEVKGLSEQVKLLRSDLAALPDPLAAVTELSRQVERLGGVLAARPDPPAQETTVRVLLPPRARLLRRRRRRGPTDNIE